MASNLEQEFLKTLSLDKQYEYMRDWFYSNYENPVEHCPYISAEGGFQYIWGGPYEAHPVLWNAFADAVPPKLIEKLADELDSECEEWSGKPSLDEEDELFYDQYSSNPDPLNTLELALDDILTILREAKIPETHLNLYSQLLYQNAITVTEVFLCDLFINRIMRNEKYLRRFVATNPAFQQEKVSISQVYEVMENIEKKVRKFLVSLVWHRLHIVKDIYQKTFEIVFPEIAVLISAIQIRHDIIHRNGKTVEGEAILVKRQEVLDLITAIGIFARELTTIVPIEQINDDELAF